MHSVLDLFQISFSIRFHLLFMARGGGAHGGGNNGGRGSSDSGGSRINNNRFGNLETNDRSPGEDSNSPYFLSNNENLGLFLVSAYFIGSNFNS